MRIASWLQSLVPGDRSTPVQSEPEPAPVEDIVLPARLEGLARAMDRASQYEETQHDLSLHLRQSVRSAEQAAAAPLGLAGLVLELAHRGYDVEERARLARAGASWMQDESPSPALTLGLKLADKTTTYEDELEVLELALHRVETPGPREVALQMAEVPRAVEDRAAMGRQALTWLMKEEPSLELGLKVADKTTTYEDEWEVFRETLRDPGPGLGERLMDCLSTDESRAGALQVVISEGGGQVARLARASSGAVSWEDDAAALQALLKAATSSSDPLVLAKAMVEACSDAESAAKVGGKLLEELTASHPERVSLARGLIAVSSQYEVDRAILEGVLAGQPALELCRQLIESAPDSQSEAQLGQAALNLLQQEHPLASFGMLAGQATTTYEADAACCQATLRALEENSPPLELVGSVLSDLDDENLSKAGQAMLPGLRACYATAEADALIEAARQRIKASDSYELDAQIVKELLASLGALKGAREQVESLAAAVSGEHPGAAVAETGNHVILGNVALKVRGRVQKG